MKNRILYIILAILSVLFTACTGPSYKSVKDTVWENEKGSISFSDEGVVTVNEEGKDKQIYYYMDCVSKQDTRYIKCYKDKKALEDDEMTGFIPYKISEDKLYFNEEIYTVQKEGK
ncbi:MAG: hypothetical protein IJC89_06120 [Clostridia bacterium]|nr:hypothetical protein [Clostridia bacterium]